MGYNCTGELCITVPEISATEMLLRSSELEQCAGFPLSSSASLVDMLSEALGFEDVEVSNNESGGVVLFSHYYGKWRSQYDSVLEWIASCGAGIEGKLVGEDDYSWGYNIAPESRAFVEYSYARVRQQDAASIDNLKCWVEDNPTEVVRLPSDLQAILKGMS